MKLRNVSPHGDLDIPLIRREVPAGEVFEVTDEQAAVLLLQVTNFEPADRAAKGALTDAVNAVVVDPVVVEVAPGVPVPSEGQTA